ncbi:hypothetical protein [Hyphococcus sp.]|jgi:hypothetical protein|uniref:hypothetical protein n=1 Tax=Hyphococcus sp. TaxID=2038636 RepID=UPI003D130C2C
MTASAPARTISLNPAGVLSERWRFPAAVAAVIVLSFTLRIGPTTPDVSWLIDMCVRILNGERAYIDVFETTPPVPVLLYMPGAWIERHFSIPAELAVIAYAYAAYSGVLWLMLRLLPEKLEGLGPARWFVVFPAGLYLFILTNDTFAQRETFSAALMAPMICALIAWRQTGAWPPLSLRAAAAVLAGLAAAIKPPLFTLPLLFCGAYLIVTERSLRPIYSSGLIASAFAFAAITAASFAIFPAYFDGVYQLMRDVYVPIRHHVVYGVFSDAFLFAAACILLMRVRPKERRSAGETDRLLLIVSAGFMAAYFGQAKYFDYHVTPIGLFAFVVAWNSFLLNILAIGETKASRSRLWLIGGLLAFISAGLFHSFDDDEPKLHDRSWAEDLENPTAMAISSGYITGYPLAREIGATWVNRIHCQWAITYPQAMMSRQRVSEEQTALFKKYQNDELDRVAALIPEKKPEIIIQSTTATSLWLADKLLERNPALFDDYAVVAEEGVFRIWRRKISLKENAVLKGAGG